MRQTPDSIRLFHSFRFANQLHHERLQLGFFSSISTKNLFHKGNGKDHCHDHIHHMHRALDKIPTVSDLHLHRSRACR